MSCPPCPPEIASPTMYSSDQSLSLLRGMDGSVILGSMGGESRVQQPVQLSKHIHPPHHTKAAISLMTDKNRSYKLLGILSGQNLMVLRIVIFNSM